MIWKPGQSVQVRELNQLQDFTQTQIERFADNIFKRGTITNGCNFTFHNDYPYIKILDSDVNGLIVDPSLLVGLKLVNSANLQAFVINSEDGSEATNPDLKTLYLTYTNSGNTGSMNSFAADDTLTAYDPQNAVFDINVVAGSSGFSNNDTVVVLPAILVALDTGVIANNDYITQGGANVQVLAADYTTYAAANQVLLTLAARNADLANAQVNSVAWTINALDSISNPSNSISGFVVQSFGSGLDASIVTNGIGKITSVPVLDRGSNYLYPPTITVRSINNLTGINSLNLVAQNYYSKFKVASVAEAAGSGYAFQIGDGIIYQNGYMLRVTGQTIIVDKYSQSPNNVVVGFSTVETIVNANEDDDLFDNALSTKNFTAPGADRLKMTPKLTLLSSEIARANTDFNILVEWSEGNPFRQNKNTQYSDLGDQMAQRTFDQSGNFVIDTFQVATTFTANSDADAQLYTTVVDPGQAYISGFKVQTLANYYIDVDKGLDTQTANNTISLNLGNYIRLKDCGGIFQFSTGDSLDLYDTAKSFLSTPSLVETANTTPQGTKIGTARCRSMVLEDGIPGDPSATYRLYLFNINMNSGRSFNSVKSVYYNGSKGKGIADVILTQTNAGNVAVLGDTNIQGLVFPAGTESVKATANSTYVYRTLDQTTNFANTGILTKSIAANPNEFFPYSGNLSFAQMKELYVVPVANALVQYSNIEGILSTTSGTATIDGDANTNFFSSVAIGDWICVFANAAANNVRKVAQIVNSSRIVVSSNLTFSNTACNYKRIFPQYVPIPFGSRAGLSANVDANNNVLKLTMAHANGMALTLAGTTSTNTAIGVNIKRTNVGSTAKTANRKQFVKLYCGNNAGNTVGPWCLGVSDALRLRGVFQGNASVNTSSTNITSSFYIDTNQNEDYIDLSYLMMNPRKHITLSATDYLLVEFDYLTRSDDGYFDTVSYLGTSNTQQIATIDATPFANLSSAVTSYEVPELYTKAGVYWDLLKAVDFRPAVANTVAPSTDPSTAPLNPPYAVSFGNTADPTNDKKFPLPDASMTTTLTQYIGRVDSVFIAGDTGEIYVLKGTPDIDPRKRFPANHPKETLLLQMVNVPAYPNITNTLSKNMMDILSTGIANERYAGLRAGAHLIAPILSSYEFQLSQPMVYTNEDIANLERRIKDLEYYQSLSILETSITNKIIPSSIDGTLNRFKFGFFADDFSTMNYGDITNPQYAASYETEGTQPWGISKSPLATQNWANSDVVDPNNKMLSPTGLVQKATNRVTPPKMMWSMDHVLDNLSYVDETIISQTYATNSSSNVECVPKTVNVVVAATNGYFTAAFNNFTNPNQQKPEPAVVTFGQKSGTATIYFDNGPNFTKYSVYLGNTLIATTNSSANLVTNLTQADLAYLGQSGNKTGFTISKNITDFTRSGDYVKNVGKFQFVHDASRGQTYTVTAQSSATDSWRYLVEYPLTNPATTATTVDPCVITNVITNLTAAPAIVPYVGTINVTKTFQGWSCSKQFAINHIQVAEVTFQVVGLKPLTAHKFYLDGVDYSAWCETIPWATGVALGTGVDNAFSDALIAIINKVGQPLVTDASGKMYVAFYLPMNLPKIATAEPQNNQKKVATGVFLLNPGQNAPSNIDVRAGANWATAIYNSRNQTSWGSSGYSTITISAPNSVATKLVAQRLPGSTIPTTPSGYP